MLAFLAFLAAQATLIVRPADVFEALAGLQLFLPCIVAAMVFALPNLIYQLKPRQLFRQPISLCVLSLIGCVAISHLQWGLLGFAFHSTVMFAKSAGYYFVLMAVLTTPRRMKLFLIVTAISATIMVSLSIRDFRAFNDEWLGRSDLIFEHEQDQRRPEGERVIRHVLERHGVTAEGDPVIFFRMRGFGVFSDPNDIALLIVSSFILLLYFTSEPDTKGFWPVWVGMIGVLLYGLWLTQSRGGLLAAGGAGLVFLLMKYGQQVATVIGLAGAGIAPLALGRLGAISLSSGTGQDRIQLWAEGLDHMKGLPVLLGIGQGQYSDITSSGLVAHNSYVHAFVELGLVGGTFFAGMLFFATFGFYRLRSVKHEITDRTVFTLLPVVAAITAGWAVGMGSLSRCYTPATYLVFGVAASYLNLAGVCLRPPRPVVRLNRYTLTRWATFSVVLLILAYAFIRIFARFE